MQFWKAFGSASILCAFPISAKTIDVNSQASLQSAIDGAAPGDEIIMANGSYSFGGKITITKKGTQALPITIAAETVGGVEIKGGGGFAFGAGAEYVAVRGFKFTHASGTTSIAVGANHCRFTRNVFQMTGNSYKSYLSVSGDDSEIDHNEFRDKNFVGQMITVQGPGSNGMAQRTWIHHNYFHDFPNCGANNCSAIQIGLSSRSLSPANSIVEYNLFVNTRGENENICNKSCDNIFRYNTFRDNASELSVRHGNRMQVYGNFFFKTDGLRFSGDDHKIFSNYFQECTIAINMANGDGVVPGDDLKSHDRADSVKVVFNTMVNNKTNFIMPSRGGGLGATKLTFANNLIVGGPAAVSINGPNPNPIWEGNIIWGNSGGGGAMPASGYATADPKMAPDANGVHHLSAGSEVIGKSAGSYPYVIVDIDGQPRGGGSELDVGADEHSSAPVINRPLVPADVGPNGTYEGSVSVGARRSIGSSAPDAFKIGGGWFTLDGRLLRPGPDPAAANAVHVIKVRAN